MIYFPENNTLIPAIIQDNISLQVLMVGYMNEDAFIKTQREGIVTFFSRKRNCLWTKGETSGNYLLVNNMLMDCDNDTLLIKVTPLGPTCHTGNTSCFAEETTKGFIYRLQSIINDRIDKNVDNSYTNTLYKKGINTIAQKVGEEAIELIIESKDNNEELFKGEAADLLYHFLVLLKAKNMTLEDIEGILFNRYIHEDIPS
ncbi:MAG: bifunctional phosphoribosyl-AMP cyclohydrolase/phosphoribosyl-ATP diphosphatase HisIE [Candidatus Kapaibacterium sp.]|jgi:phosphoribosyl-ATP pyrophosphohydrolase/phosphoribosyl-AMP cyclohydrolase